MMTKIRVVLLILLLFGSIYNGKATTETNEDETTETTKAADQIPIDDQEEESDSIQVVNVNRDPIDVTTTATINDSVDEDETQSVSADSSQEENFTVAPRNADINTAPAVTSANSEDLKNDSDPQLESQGDEEELAITARTIEVNEDLSKNQEQIEVIVEPATSKAVEIEAKRVVVSAVEKDAKVWRSAEHDDEIKKYATEPMGDESGSEDTSDEYIDTQIDIELKSRMDSRAQEKKPKYTRPTAPRYMEPREERGLLDSGPIRTFTEVVVPRYRPVLTRSGIVYTPTLLSMQSRSPLLDRLSGHWPSRNHYSPEEMYPISRPRGLTVSAPQFEETKMIDDYNDYGSNTYSYMPNRRATTPRTPHQVPTPNKFDVFQKLVEASNHPKSQKRTFSDLHQRSFPESYG
ncbi:hypothetical protein B5X24_HaOG205113 [Helicoverpa armigera]|uniref:Uncharacterized protein n=1 Tax=Helicoverpa armigera TaxID=29058 RepID=A0A2W1BM38_HELAM|nr:hypothetical protein B5X24_HaOG205113 [Helicoverpa armigera]